jgi:DNA repair exonuclease SbcCD ATPase subunit
MKILALRLFNVRRFAGRGVAIEGIADGVNVLSAPNEFGKSTSFEALHALFFQPHGSVGGEVKKLRPYSGGNPLIEADIALGTGQFRIAKQYLGGRFAKVTDLQTGRLVAQADEAENFIAGLVTGGTSGPAGLLWVRQGLTGLEKRGKTEEEGERELRRSLLESVQGEVEAVTGGRRMAAILAATQEALSELVTATGRPKAGGRYHAAIEDRDRLAGQEQRLAGEVATLQQQLEQRAKAARRLAELDSPVDRQERRKAVEAAQAAFDAAKAQTDRLTAAEAELKLARDRRDAAERDFQMFRSALDRAADLRCKLQAAEERRRNAIDSRREADEAIGRAIAETEAAEAGEQIARNLLSRLDAAMRAREASERLAEVKDQLAQAEAARLSLEQGEAQLALLKVSPRAIDELQALELEIAKLRAVKEAALASVIVRYEPAAAVRISMNGEALPEAEERTYDGQTLLSVPGIGTLTLRSNRLDTGDDRLHKALEKRKVLLADLKAEDLAAARARQVQAQRLEAELGELRGRLSQLAPQGLPKLREDVAARAAAAVDGPDLNEDPDQVRAAFASSQERLKHARLSQRETEPRRARANDAFVEAETALAALRAEQAHVTSILGPENARSLREQDLRTGLDERMRVLADAEAHAARLRATIFDLDNAEASLRRARSAEDAATLEANQLREAIAGLNAEIRTRSDEAVEEKWRETGEALAAASARLSAFEKEVAVLQRLQAALETARSDARDLYLKPVLGELTPLLGLLFDDVAISFDDKSLLPQVIRRNGLDEDIERLSGGMREQLSILTRLAFARMLARDGRPAPVILDDALVYSDDDRIEKMFDALHRQSKDQQIIVFSCRQRAFQRLGGNVLRMSDWQP